MWLLYIPVDPDLREVHNTSSSRDLCFLWANKGQSPSLPRRESSPSPALKAHKPQAADCSTAAKFIHNTNFQYRGNSNSLGDLGEF